jgi:glycosyltransferase (TIGR04182 family)
MVDPSTVDVTVLVPTYNEAGTIGDVLGGLQTEGFEDILVVDGNSTDGTRDLAREAGARVEVQSGPGRGSGKGQAVREGIDAIESEYILMLDGDGTYRPSDAPRLLGELVGERAEHVIGNRFADMATGAMSRLNRFGNGVIDRLFALTHDSPRMDILSGFRAFTRESVDRMTLTADGFGIETEMSAECARLGIEMTEVPIHYGPRPDGSATSLRPFRDGGRILLTMYLRTKTSNPLVYFGAASAFFGTLGVIAALYVLFEWVVRGISHEVIALLAAFSVLVAVQLLMFGLLSDLLVTLHSEQMRELREE